MRRPAVPGCPAGPVSPGEAGGSWHADVVLPPTTWAGGRTRSTGAEGGAAGHRGSTRQPVAG